MTVVVIVLTELTLLVTAGSLVLVLGWLAPAPPKLYADARSVSLSQSWPPPDHPRPPCFVP